MMPHVDGVADVAPHPPRDEVELYVRTYSTILHSSGDVPLRALERTHGNVGSSLHARAVDATVDTGALLYAVNRLPAVIAQVQRVVLGQLPEHFAQALGVDVDAWQSVQAPARRRQWHFDGASTLAVHVVSPSDIDDVVPTLVAYQIEWNKLHDRLAADRHAHAALAAADAPGDLDRLGERLGIEPSDWRRLLNAWRPDPAAVLRTIAAAPKNMTVRLLGGTHVGYTKLTRRWWEPIGRVLDAAGGAERPVYFVSSNLHSLVNLLSGYARRRTDTLWAYLDECGEREPDSEAAALARLRGRANTENVLYYAARLWHQAPPGERLTAERAQEEQARGIVTIAPTAGVDVGAQVIDLARVRPDDVDPRLGDLAEVVGRSDALILNFDYPLGLAAYSMLRQVAEAVDSLAGVYILGKAATLNGDVGDVLISDLVYDEHTRNTYSFENAFSYQDVAPYLERGAVLDSQRAVTVKGTFLQNTSYLELFYRELFTIVEMEAGPYLAAVYEDTHTTRYPLGATVHLHGLPVDLGLIHYASDTPYTRARTLGNRSLSFEGVDATYASAVAILRRILGRERTDQRLGRSY